MKLKYSKTSFFYPFIHKSLRLCVSCVNYLGRVYKHIFIFIVFLRNVTVHWYPDAEFTLQRSNGISGETFA